MNTLLSPALLLLCASFVVLFQELALIRWLGTQVRALAYFPNLILISAFLGLGIGCLRVGKKSLWLLWPISLALLGISTYFLSEVAFTQEGSSEHLWLLYYDLGPDKLVVNNIYFPIFFYFALSALSFIYLGQLVGTLIEDVKKSSHVLVAYAWDIFGSILGVVGFTIASYLGLFPIYWFACFLVLGILLLSKRQFRGILVYLGAACILLASVHVAEKARIYSPYYALDHKEHNEVGFAISANGSLHQKALQINPEFYAEREVPPKEYNYWSAVGYNTPYKKYLNRPPRNVLVLGAGNGNDVATALLNGAETVDAVEIDPEIIKLGKKFHPNKPYDSDKVTIHNMDARAFLNTTDKKFDLIVFGTLDSMTRLSALSNVRLDNFVYTKESLEAAKDRLTNDGGIMLLFMVGQDYIDFRLLELMALTFKQVPLIYSNNHNLFNHAYMGGPAFEHNKGDLRRQRYEEQRATIENSPTISNDDWPYLYLKNKSLSTFYMVIISVILIASYFCITLAAGGRLKVNRLNSALFLFGLSFLLIETKSITSMSLVWGATWLTSAVVFVSILALILLATLIQLKVAISFRLAFVGLFVSTIAVYFIPTSLLAGMEPVSKLLCSMFMVGTPIFFAAICFADLFSKSESPGESFGWNILGAVVGGLLEFFSMIIGLKALLLVALAAYLVAFLLAGKGKFATSA